ncbi:MAG: hypothetical protein MR368_07320 [Azospirillum sp.]|nr:hypothetical protein [Azospirillum sp.]
MSQIDKFHQRYGNATHKKQEVHSEQVSTADNSKKHDTEKRKNNTTYNDLSELGELKETIEQSNAEDKNMATEDNSTDKKTSENAEEEKLGLADLGFSDEFLQSKHLTADSKVTKAQLEELKEEFAKQSLQNASEQSAENEGENQGADDQENDAQPTADQKDNDMEDVRLSPSQDTIQVDNDKTWVDKYEAILKGYAEANNQEWKRDLKDENGADIEGLQGSIGDAKYHFTAEDKVSVNAAGIEGLVNLAKETGQDINFNEKWSEEFKAKMMEACEKYGVSIVGKPEEQKTENREAEAQPVQTANNEETKSYIGLPKTAEIELRKYNRLASGEKGEEGKKELDDTIARMEAAGATIGGENRESQKYTMALYAKACYNKEDAETMHKLENVMTKYGMQVGKKQSEDGKKLDFEVSINKSKYDKEAVASDIKILSEQRSNTAENQSNKYKQRSGAFLNGQQPEGR